MAKIVKTALITGITGQDGSYLAEILLERDYRVFGMVRRSSSFNTSRIDHIFNDVDLVFGDLSDGSSIHKILKSVKPDEVYNLGAQSHVRVSFDIPEYTADIDAMGTLRLLDAIHTSGRKTKFYEAGSSEMFGDAPIPQDESTPFHPRSPYGVSKVFGYWITRNYRESYNTFAVNGILFNHESPRRGATFVTRKITRAIHAIRSGEQDELVLGNLDAKRDWGYAKDYMLGAWMMMQADRPKDYVLATGESHSVRDFLDEAFGYMGMDWKHYVNINPRYFRPAEVDHLLGDASKARNELGWKPSITFDELVHMMVDSDCAS